MEVRLEKSTIGNIQAFSKQRVQDEEAAIIADSFDGFEEKIPYNFLLPSLRVPSE